MENSLVKRIERGILKVGAPLLIGGLALINSGCGVEIKHNIDGKTIVTPSENNHLIRVVNGDLVIVGDTIYINSPKINSMRGAESKYKLSYKTHEDSVVINQAQEDVDYYLNKIDSTDKADQKKVDYYLNKIDSTNKAERIRTGLEALK